MNKAEVKVVLAQVKSQWRRDGEVDDDLALLVFEHEEVFGDLIPARVWDEVSSQALCLLTPYNLERGYMDTRTIRRQMWRSKDFHKRMCSS